MKFIFLSIFLIISNNIFSSQIEDIRELYVQSSNSLENAVKLQKLTNDLVFSDDPFNKDSEKIFKNPYISGYLASSFFLIAKNSKNIFLKFKNFEIGKFILEKLILNFPDNLELIILRNNIQKNCPKALNYDDSLVHDIFFIEKNIHLFDNLKMLTNVR